MKILINTISTKKQSGGAFQISQNFLLKTKDHPEIDWYYITSQDVDDVIGEYFVQIRNIKYFVFPTQPDFGGSFKLVKKQIRELELAIKPDVIYSVTSPCYFTFVSKEVMRFTNPWVTHPNKYAWKVLSFRDKVKYYLYGINQKRLMKNAQYFITQTETCAEGIRRITGVPKEQVKVVNNVLPAVFKTIDNEPIQDDDYVNIACVGAATTHKNFNIIPEVLHELKKKGLNDVRIHTTLPPDDGIYVDIINRLRAYGIEDMYINHGRITQQQLGDMYRRCQFCFLPSLLEVFSASTVEAMYFQLPIVATDFGFNREVMDDACLYYEPMNPMDAASKLSMLINNKELQREYKSKMQERLNLYGDYEQHFNDICDYLKEVVNIDN